MLSGKLKMFKAMADRLEEWLNKEGQISNALKMTIRSSLSDCLEIINDIEDHVAQITYRSSGGMSISSTLRMLWDEGPIQEFDTMVGTQMQIFGLFIQLLQL
jgi:hypothetical protein